MNIALLFLDRYLMLNFNEKLLFFFVVALFLCNQSINLNMYLLYVVVVSQVKYLLTLSRCYFVETNFYVCFFDSYFFLLLEEINKKR